MNDLDLLLIDLLILSFMSPISFDLFLLLRCGGVNAHQEQGVFVMLLDYSQRSNRMMLDVLLNLLYCFAVFLFTGDVPLLLVSHPVLQSQSLNPLDLKAFPCLAILCLPIFSSHGPLYQ
jgi:hypothetical protein